MTQKHTTKTTHTDWSSVIGLSALGLGWGVLAPFQDILGLNWDLSREMVALTFIISIAFIVIIYKESTTTSTEQTK